MKEVRSIQTMTTPKAVATSRCDKAVAVEAASPTKLRIIPQKRARIADVPLQCWAHSRTGKRCRRLVSSREGEPIPIPYCNHHLKHGDGAVKMVKHPLFGNALVARYDLPAKYRLVYWGKRGKCPPSNIEDRSISYYPPNPITGSNIDPTVEGGRTTKRNNYNGVLNPSGTGDLMQFAGCPGPNERQNMRSTFQYFGLRNGTLGGLECVTVMPIPKNTQFLHWYGAGWWSERDIKRQDVGTSKYPAPLRQAMRKSSDL